MSSFLPLNQAISEGRLADFAAQAEALGVGPADRTLFDATVKRVTAPLPEGQTSRSPGRGSSRGK